MAEPERDPDEETPLLASHSPASIIRRVRSVWKDFIDFVASDNVLQVAVGLIIAQGFTSVVNSVVTDLLLPLVSLLPFIQKNFAQKFLVLRYGPHPPYNTVDQALEDGAVVMTYGAFISNVVNFFFLGVFLFSVAHVYTFITKKPIISHTVRCEYCRKYVSTKAKRCFNCTSWLDGREEKATSTR
ncbi:gated mechanosensitive channel [Atractiella rhizophila]|nr:gated mechanosensitive channel [Atractiella rhizophila]